VHVIAADFLAAAAAMGAAALLAVVGVRGRRRLVRARKIRSVLSLGAPLTGNTLRDVLRALTADPDLEIYYRLRDSAEYVTSAGEPAAPASRAPGESPRRLAGAGTTDRHGFAVLFDTAQPAARSARSLQRAVLDAGAPALENAWLQATLRRQVSQMARSRSSTVRAFLAERRRLEGQLHDGAQASLYEARYQVQQARAQLAGTAAATSIDAAAIALGEAITELRTLVRGIYPAGLRESGLGSALFTATSGFPLVVDIAGDADQQVDEETATAGFFTVMDVLYIAARSRAQAAKVRISSSGGRVRLRIAYLPGKLPRGSSASRTAHETDALLAAEDRVRALDGTMRITHAETAVTVEVELPCV
jgi:signal transduction histidine kinase